jgi:hypothetical protein
MKKLLKRLTPESIKQVIPYVGIVAFAGCSVHALSEFFAEMARTPSRWYDIASWLVEGFTAYVITLLIAQVKIVTATVGRSGVRQQDQRMAWVLVGCYTVIAGITITVSVIANQREFGGNVWLGLLFPSLCIACAIAAGMDAVARAKKKEKTREPTSDVEGNGSKPKRAKKELERFIARCPVAGCDWVGNEGKPYTTSKKAGNAINGHMRKHKEKDNE